MDQFDRRVTVVPAIEVVDTRFASYDGTPALHRAADLMSNGALIHGEPWADSDANDLTKLPVKLYSGSTLLADTVGGHSAVDPRLPALAFLQSAGRPDHLPRGTIIRSEEHTSELQSLMRISYAVFCLKNTHKPKRH